jgi:hypothetical protein
MRMIGLKRLPGRIRVTADEGEFDVVFSGAPAGHPGGDPFVELLPSSSVDKEAAEALMFELMREGRIRRPQ